MDAPPPGTDPVLKKLLEDNLIFARDNNRLLRAIRRGQWYAFAEKVIVWAVVLAIPVLLYQHYIRPVIDKFTTIGGQGSTTPSFFVIPTTTELQKLINSYKVGQ